MSESSVKTLKIITKFIACCYRYQLIFYGTVENKKARSTGNIESHKLPLTSVEMIEKEEMTKSRNLKLKRNTGDKRKKTFQGKDVRENEDFLQEKNFEDRRLDDQLEQREYNDDAKKEDDLYGKVLRELEDMLDDGEKSRSRHDSEEKRGKEAARELLDEINEILQKNK